MLQSNSHRGYRTTIPQRSAARNTIAADSRSGLEQHDANAVTPIVARMARYAAVPQHDDSGCRLSVTIAAQQAGMPAEGGRSRVAGDSK
jgi:hypothetical protein